MERVTPAIGRTSAQFIDLGAWTKTPSFDGSFFLSKSVFFVLFKALLCWLYCYRYSEKISKYLTSSCPFSTQLAPEGNLRKLGKCSRIELGGGDFVTFAREQFLWVEEFRTQESNNLLNNCTRWWFKC